MSLGALGQRRKDLKLAMTYRSEVDAARAVKTRPTSCPEPNGGNPAAKIKQWLGPFRCYSRKYLNACEELEIKVGKVRKPARRQLPA